MEIPVAPAEVALLVEIDHKETTMMINKIEKTMMKRMIPLTKLTINPEKNTMMMTLMKRDTQSRRKLISDIRSTFPRRRQLKVHNHKHNLKAVKLHNNKKKEVIRKEKIEVAIEKPTEVEAATEAEVATEGNSTKMTEEVIDNNSRKEEDTTTESNMMPQKVDKINNLHISQELTKEKVANLDNMMIERNHITNQKKPKSNNQ